MVVIATFVVAVAQGILRPLSVYANRHILDDGMLVAQGAMAFSAYIPYLALLVLVTVLRPVLGELVIFGYLEPRCMMILNTAFKGEMLQKLKRMRYQHFESAASMEIIDKAFGRAVNSARHLFPMYITLTLSGAVASVGVLVLFVSVRWWLVLTLLAPFAVQLWWNIKHSHNVYEELEHYWNRERRYTTLASFLKSRDYLYEGKLNGSSDFLIDTYQTRLHARNEEYERFYWKHLKGHFAKGNLTKLATVLNAVLLLMLYARGAMSVGTLAALTLSLFSQLFDHLFASTIVFRWSGYHIKFFDYYTAFFDLSEDEEGDESAPPERLTIEFRDVWFRYPGDGNPDVLKGLTLTIDEGEKISLVGENGEGKSTMIKLLLGLFTPDRGEILLGGKPIDSYTRAERNRLFAPIFQDFVRYSVTLGENIAVGDVAHFGDRDAIARAAAKGLADTLAHALPDGYDTLLGRDFVGGVDLSGGQWQRIAIARAFIGDKPILLLDEPTSQLDPMAESSLYAEFRDMAEGKTALFITHRLASTMITDRILVLSGGRVAEEGDHETLMRRGGLYARMFDAQRKWYTHGVEEAI